MKTLTLRFTLPVLALLGFSAAGVVASAAPTTLPVMAKRFKTVSTTGKVRSTECLVHTDGAVIYRSIDGIQTVEERNVQITTSLAAKIDEAASAKTETRTMSPIEFSFSQVAFRTSSSGIQDTVVLGSFDGPTGVEVYNTANAAYVLKELLNSICD